MSIKKWWDCGGLLARLWTDMVTWHKGQRTPPNFAALPLHLGGPSCLWSLVPLCILSTDLALPETVLTQAEVWPGLC